MGKTDWLATSTVFPGTAASLQVPILCSVFIVLREDLHIVVKVPCQKKYKKSMAEEGIQFGYLIFFLYFNHMLKEVSHISVDLCSYI